MVILSVLLFNINPGFPAITLVPGMMWSLVDLELIFLRDIGR